MKKENVATAVYGFENDNRIVIDLDRLIALFKSDDIDTNIEQLNIPETN